MSWRARRATKGGGRNGAPPDADPVELLVGIGTPDDLDEHFRMVAAVPAGSDVGFVFVQFDVVDFDAVAADHGPLAASVVMDRIGVQLARLSNGRGPTFRTGPAGFAVVLEGVDDAGARSWARDGTELLRQPVEVPGGDIQVQVAVAVVPIEPGMTLAQAAGAASVTMLMGRETGSAAARHSAEVEEWLRAKELEVDQLTREIEELRLENRRLLELTLVDLQTGLANASAFEADHVQLHARRKRKDEPYVILMVSVDRYGTLIERFGTDITGEVVKAIGACIRDTVRESDRAYRLIDDEFSVLLPGAELKEGVAAAERVRAKVERLALGAGGESGDIVTVTVGAVAVGFRHTSHKDVVNELTDLMRSSKGTPGNRALWPR